MHQPAAALHPDASPDFLPAPLELLPVPLLPVALGPVLAALLRAPPVGA